MYLTHTEKHDDYPSSLGLSADKHVDFKEALDTIIHKKNKHLIYVKYLLYVTRVW